MVFPLLENLKVSKRGELEVSEINDWYVKNGEMTATIMKGYWSDMGIPSSMHKTMDYINNSSYIIDSPKE
jgi:glucose-1-phosphate thymidylyltransferase